MARLQAFYAVDSFLIDLNFYLRHFYDDLFFDNQGHVFGGQPYQDVYLINGDDGYNDLVLGLGGHGIGFNAFGDMNRGTVTALGEQTYDGVDLWVADGFAVPAIRFSSAALTSSNIDDRAVFVSMMSGNDTIRLSRFDDRFEAWGGHDHRARQSVRRQRAGPPGRRRGR